MDTQIVKKIIEDVVAELGQTDSTMPVEVSGRHVHLSSADAEKLFGKPLANVRELSQPGQYLCKERVRLIGPKGVLDNVAVLGPARDETQVEVSLTDARLLGARAPIRQSGDISGSSGVMIASEKGIVELAEGLIVPGRHIHMAPEDASRLNVADKEMVSVRVGKGRSVVFEDVLVRVSDSYRLAMHIDFDEGNACCWTPETSGQIIKNP